MYVLSQLVYRSHTTDTLIHGVSKDRSLFEEFVLSIWEETYHNTYNYYVNNSYPHKTALSMAKFEADSFSEKFHITKTSIWDTKKLS